jgi:cysteine desulfurase
MALDLAGIAVSAGSACSSGKVAASPVLAAMGLPAPIQTSAIRVSLGVASTADEVDAFLQTWKSIAAGHRAAA